MKYIRTNDNFIFTTEDESINVGYSFILDTIERIDVKHKVILVGDSLKDLIIPGDFVEYSFGRTKKNKKPIWLIKITKSNINEIKEHARCVVNKIIVKSGGEVLVESVPYDLEKAKKKGYISLGMVL